LADALLRQAQGARAPQTWLEGLGTQLAPTLIGAMLKKGVADKRGEFIAGLAGLEGPAVIKALIASGDPTFSAAGLQGKIASQLAASTAATAKDLAQFKSGLTIEEEKAKKALSPFFGGTGTGSDHMRNLMRGKDEFEKHGKIVTPGLAAAYSLALATVGKGHTFQDPRGGGVFTVPGVDVTQFDFPSPAQLKGKPPSAPAPDGGETPPGVRTLIPSREVKYTGEEGKAAGFASRTITASDVTRRLEADPDFDPASVRMSFAASSGVLGNFALTDIEQQYVQAKRDWITGVLRPESGAAISASELVEKDRTFFPQPGDKPPVILQKARAREQEIRSLIAQSGGAFADKFPNMYKAFKARKPLSAAKPNRFMTMTPQALLNIDEKGLSEEDKADLIEALDKLGN
jgi:hypothetical protein